MSALLDGSLFGSTALTLLVLGALGLVALLVGARLVFAPAAAAAVLVAVVVSNISSVVGEVGPASVYLAALGLATLALGFGVLRGEVALRFSPFFLLFGVFLAVRALSVLVAADDVGAGIVELTDETKALVLLVVLTLLLASVAPPERMARLAVTVVAGLAALTAVQEFVLRDSSSLGGLTGIGVASEVAGLGARHSGPHTDPNFWCRVLVLFLPLALALLWSRSESGAGHRDGSSLRWRWVAAAGLLLVGAYLSQSRGGMIAIFVTGVLMLTLMVRNRTRLLAGAAAVVFVLALLPGVGSRLATLGSLTGDASSAVVDPSLEGREAAQKAGLAMFEGSPLIGVGAANFEVAGDRYQRELGISVTQRGGLLAPHDIYVQQLAEGGVVGLVGYLVFYLGSIAAMLATRRRWRALRAHGQAGEIEQRLSTAAATGLVGWGIASIFLHLATLPILIVLLSLGAALHLRARQAEADSGLGDLLALPESRRPVTLQRQQEIGPSRAQRTTLAVLGVALLLAGGVATRSAIATESGYTVAVQLGTEPRNSDSEAYAYSVLDRPRTMPTIVTLAQRVAPLAAAGLGLTEQQLERADVRTVRDSNGSSFRILVTMPRADTATAYAQAVASWLSSYLTAEQSLYGVRVLATSPPTAVGGDRPVRIAVAGLLGSLAVLVLLAATRPAREPESEPDAFAEADTSFASAWYGQDD